jgi:hypothetical protein
MKPYKWIIQVKIWGFPPQVIIASYRYGVSYLINLYIIWPWQSWWIAPNYLKSVSKLYINNVVYIIYWCVFVHVLHTIINAVYVKCIDLNYRFLSTGRKNTRDKRYTFYGTQFVSKIRLFLELWIIYLYLLIAHLTKAI